MIDALNEKDENVQYAAAENLVLIDRKQAEAAIPYFARTLQGEYSDACRAAEQLGNIESPKVIPLLAAALMDKKAGLHVRLNAAKGLRKKGKEAKGAVPALIIALQDPHWFVQTEAALALGDLGAEAKDALPALRKATKDAVLFVRRDAAHAIKMIESGGK